MFEGVMAELDRLARIKESIELTFVERVRALALFIEVSTHIHLGGLSLSNTK